MLLGFIAIKKIFNNLFPIPMFIYYACVINCTVECQSSVETILFCWQTFLAFSTWLQIVYPCIIHVYVYGIRQERKVAINPSFACNSLWHSNKWVQTKYWHYVKNQLPYFWLSAAIYIIISLRTLCGFFLLIKHWT